MREKNISDNMLLSLRRENIQGNMLQFMYFLQLILTPLEISLEI